MCGDRRATFSAERPGVVYGPARLTALARPHELDVRADGARVEKEQPVDVRHVDEDGPRLIGGYLARRRRIGRNPKVAREMVERAERQHRLRAEIKELHAQLKKATREAESQRKTQEAIRAELQRANEESRRALDKRERELAALRIRAEQLQRSTREALVAAEAAARQTTQQAESRLKVIDNELGQIATVRKVADELAAACGAGGPA
jgi:hypothetical protein